MSNQFESGRRQPAHGFAIPPPAVGGSGPDLVDAISSVNILAGESSVAPVDAATLLINIAADETNAEPTHAQTLTFPTGSFDEANPVPTEARSATLRVWLSGTVDVNGSGVANPGNADLTNDGATCDLQSVVLGSPNPEIRSDVGTNVPAGLTFSAVTYKGWFRLRTTLITSTARVVAHSSSAAF